MNIILGKLVSFIQLFNLLFFAARVIDQLEFIRVKHTAIKLSPFLGKHSWRRHYRVNRYSKFKNRSTSMHSKAFKE